MGMSCTLPMLLDETRKRRIDDDDVHHVIQVDESRAAEGCGTDRELQCFRTLSGVGYINRNTGNGGWLASANELFGELGTVAPDDSVQIPATTGPNWPLADKLREAGEELTTPESIVLDAAQTLCKTFKTGQTVDLRALKRVVSRYHNADMGSVKFTTALQSLQLKGICSRQRAFGTHLKLEKHFGNREPQRSRFAAIADCEQQEQLLAACSRCVGAGFNNQNVVQLAAVTALMQERHHMTTPQVLRVVHALVAASVLEQLPSKGSIGLRLTESAKRRLSGQSIELSAA